MKKTIPLLALILILSFFLTSYILLPKPKEPPTKYLLGETIDLPLPNHESNTSIEEAILKRRSIRDYKDESLTLAEISQILWAAQGITKEGVFSGRTAPSAGALYPLEVYLVAVNVDGLVPGLYHYNPHKNSLTKVLDGDLRQGLSDAALGQAYVKQAPADLVITAFYNRTTVKYGERGIRYVAIEAGHAAQNVYLQAVGLELGTVVVGGFNDEKVSGLLKLSKDETPLYIMPIGRPA